LQQTKEYQTNIKMGFKKLMTFKKALSLFTALTLLGVSTAMAQDAAPAAPGASAADTSGMWTGVIYYTLIFLSVCFCIAILGKVLKVYDLSSRMQGKKGINWNNIMGICCLVFLIAGMYGAYWSLTVQGSMKLPVAASAHGGDIDDMFNLTTILTLIVFVITQVCLFGFMFYYRGSDKRKAHYLPHNNTIEKIWTIIPAIVLTVLVVFGFFTWQSVMDSTERKGDLNIDITGHQFAWELRYPGPDGKLGSKKYTLTTPLNNLGVDFSDKNSWDDIHADTLVLPVNQPIRLNIHAQDVIHSVFMPHFRVQLNAVPGLPTFFRFTPTITTAQMRTETDNPNFEYLLYCNKICGGAHYNMQKVVRVVSRAEYQDWISHQKPYLTDALKKQLKMAAAKSGKVQASSNTLALNN
jgi:cytochrome c oxidase subunit 2